MDLYFESKPGEMIVSIIKYLQKVIEEWPEFLRGTKINPNTDNLFTICEEDDRQLLLEGLASQFHCTTAQFLFMYEGMGGYSDIGIVPNY